MRMIRPVISSLLLFAPHAFASTLVVSDSGSFSSTTPASVISAPGAAFSFSFNVNSNPIVSAVVPGSEFDVAYSNFSYRLNGVAVSAPLSGITFFNSSALGLFNLCFSATCLGSPAEVLAIRGAQGYSGSEAAPTLLTGNYPVSTSLISIGTAVSPLATDNPVVISQAATTVTPEPSSLVLLGTGLTGLLSLARRRLTT